MTRNRHIILAISAIAAASLSAAPAMAKGHSGYGHSVQKRAVAAQSFKARAPYTSSYTRLAQNSISAAKAKSIARAQVKGGEVVDVSRQGATYRVRVIAKNGRVVDVLVDANTGRVKR